jgi:hypothetical protein
MFDSSSNFENFTVQPITYLSFLNQTLRVSKGLWFTNDHSKSIEAWVSDQSYGKGGWVCVGQIGAKDNA